MQKNECTFATNYSSRSENRGLSVIGGTLASITLLRRRFKRQTKTGLPTLQCS